MRIQLIRSRSVASLAALASGLSVAGLVIAIAPAARAQNLLTDGDFEASPTSISPWTVTGNAGLFTYAGGDTGTNVAASYGTNDFIFNRGDTAQNAVLAQSFATVAGQRYAVTFLFGDYSGKTTATTQSLDVAVYNGSFSASTVTGSPTASQIFTASASGVSKDFPTMYGGGDPFSFVATGTITTITFTDQVTASGTVNTDGILDNVVVRSGAVPEPAALALLGLGALPLAGLLRSARRRRNG